MGLSGTYSGTYKSPPVVHKSDFNVQTRARSAQWADSVLPPSPRAAMQQEVGHLTSRERKPSLGKQTAFGVKPPPSIVASSDRALSPRGWAHERERIQEQLTQQQSAFSASSHRSPVEEQRKMAQRAAMEHYKFQARVAMYYRERGWDNSQFKEVAPECARRRPNAPSIHAPRSRMQPCSV